MKNDILYKRKLLTEKYPIKKEDRFFELIDDLIIKIDEEKYPGSIFFFKEGNCLFIKKSKKNNSFWYSYNNFWPIFSNEYNMKYIEFQLFIKHGIEKNFKIKIPSLLYSISINTEIAVEEYFKIK